MFEIDGTIFTKEIKPKTLKAWEPFDDCRQILFSFQYYGEEELEYGDWRHPWIAGLSLLRTVGHVLDKVDSKKSNLHDDIIKNNYSKWKTNELDKKIFFEFICEERNNILKTFDVGAELIKRSDEVNLVYKTGENALGLFRQAIYWWRYQLISIESQLKTD
ncbi:hypothetical protein [Brucella pituitosa]|uniref:Uncharacterized protein n=1 Tax=Brucella pituitosa TaxID=571256 RepID=A0ABS3JY39_9HYPH|nr:hypothetical protein [Brucella pituitosa]MBO1038496.1 hypothetical protein [Brucella pituitosa]